MIFTHHGNNHPKQGQVIIGGRAYKTVTVGTRIWLAENLQLSWNGLDVSTPQNPITGLPTNPTAWFYDDDESTYSLDGSKPCGMLYNGYARQYLVDHAAGLLPTGWRVPTSSDWSYLRGAVSGAGNDLKVLDGAFGGVWPSGWNGTDVVKFGLVPAGRHVSSGFAGLDSSASFWLNYQSGGNYTYGDIANNGTMNVYSSTDEGFGRPIRLVKDA